MKHLPLRECGYAIAVVLLMLGLYLGAYLALMEREDFGGFLSATPGVWRSIPCVKYRFGGEWMADFFNPAHDLDRRLRPELWDGEIKTTRVHGLSDLGLAE